MGQPNQSFSTASITTKPNDASRTRQTKSCGFLVVRGRPIDSFLLLQTGNGYDLPKGHVETGESEFRCAIRELREETSITAEDIVVDPDFRFAIQYVPFEDKRKHIQVHKTVVIFLARLIRQTEIKIIEHKSFDWITWKPPHRFQQRVIDVSLAKLAHYLQTKSSCDTWCSPTVWPLLGDRRPCRF
jgi:8-oxo-dGTP pyrophosphatase MutT (NUDIX family)